MMLAKPASLKLKTAVLNLSLVLAVLSGLGIAPTFQFPAYAVDGCATPIVITGGGSYSLATGDNCFKYVNAAFTRGAMWSVMNGSDSTVVNLLKWYGGRNETVTNCINDSQSLNGNGAQLNNFTVAKDSGSAMYISINANKVNTVSMSIQNWQNGSGCTVAPTPVSGGGPTNTPVPTSTFTNTPLPTNTFTNTPIGPTNTPTNTPVASNTPTNTPVPTNTFTNTPVGPTNTPVSGSLKAQHKQASASPTDGEIKPHLQIVNLGGSSVALSTIKARYWYTRDTAQPQTINCDYAFVGCGNVTFAFVQMGTPVTGADFYLEVGFTAGAGSIAAGGNSGEIQPRFNKNDWSAYNEADDWSYAANASFTDNPKYTLYQNSTLVWGTEPTGGTPQPTSTFTNTPLATNTFTNTPIGPTNTPTNTPVATNTPTNTPIGPTNTPTNTPAGGNVPWLHTSGRFLQDPGNNTVILRGVSLVDTWVADSQRPGKSDIALTNMASDNAAGWYARVVRFPVYPDAIDFTPGWNAGPDTYFNNHLDPAIQNCVARGLYCIIDWHYIADYNNSTVDTATRNFWTYIAPRYANTPNVIFELYNEPIAPNDWNTWKTWAQPWVNIIRAAAPNNLILIGGPNWSQNVSQAASSPFTGSNLMYVAHVYPQHGGQSTWDSWFGNSSATVPYFITEWGWQNGGGAPTSGTFSGYGSPFSAYLDTKGVSWTAWVFDNIWQPVMFDTNWNILGGENFMGQFTKDFLFQHRNDNQPGGGSPTATPTNTPVATNTPTNTPIGPTPTATNTPVPGSHLSNPFAGASWYVNPDWAASVNASGVSASKKALVSSQNTAVWLDSIGTLNGTNGARGLIGHLDHAVATGKNLIIIVVYDLPGRDCSALASNGELPGTAAGLNTYKTSYIDVIAADIASKPAYANLRIVAVIEPDSLPNLVTNLSDPECSAINSNGLYVQGIQYAINKLHAFSNLYIYLDIGHAGWLGWPNNFNPAITLYKNTVKGTTAGGSSIDGFVDNTANNQVQTEPYMTANQMINGNPVRSAFFFSWNDYIQEDTFDAAWKTAMTTGTDAIPVSSANMLIDTARNGWGGCGGGVAIAAPCRPTGPSTSTVLETFVNASRIDRRPAKGGWCNQNGAGIGERPTASPNNPVYQAFIWVKPPGESDGSSSLIPIGPDNPDGKGFDQMCDPNYGGNSLNQNMNSNALPNAPVSGRWFEAQFQQLVANAWPAIP